MKIEFESFVAMVCEKLEQTSKAAPQIIAACKTGEDFEKQVVDAVNDVIREAGIKATAHYSAGSHVFPDIVIEYSDGTRYGIEVKSSSSPSKSWRINGNSVLGSTKKDVVDTYIIFGKTAIGHQAFRFKRYEDAIVNVAVTHSPRYVIDLDTADEDTFFRRSGLNYKQISESHDPIGAITSYFKSQGLRAWWLTETSPAAVRLFSDLDEKEQSEMIGYAFAHFPELFSNDRRKFYRCALWMIMDRSVVSTSLRDNFTAGGRMDLSAGNYVFHGVPQIFYRLRIYRDDLWAALDRASAEELKTDWELEGEVGNSLSAKMQSWINVAAQAMNLDTVDGHPMREFLMSIVEK